MNALSRTALRFLLFYVCILFTQPQNRFLFLYPFHIADIAVCVSVVCHVLACSQEGRPILRFGQGTILTLILIVAGLTSQYAGALQTSTAWNGFIDVTMKATVVTLLAEAMCYTIQRVWMVQATMLLATLWWIKGGLRLAAAGATFAGDRLMGPAVSLIENPNGFAYMMCTVIPLYLYFYQQSGRWSLKAIFIGLALSATFIVLKTGSRTGYLSLIAIGIFILPKYGLQHKTAIAVATIAIIGFSSALGALNVERFKTIPGQIMSFINGTDADPSTLDQDAQSANERRMKNADTWKLIKKYPLLGAGMNPDESLFADEFPYATGQVHCEWLTAGKQMGFLGMGIYFAMIGMILVNGQRIQWRCKHSWPAISDLGWTIKIQGIAFFIGGSFSPVCWNPPMMLLVAVASSLWSVVNELPVAPPVSAPIAPAMIPASST